MIFSYSFPKATIINNTVITRLFVIILMCVSLYVIIITDLNYTDRSQYTQHFYQSMSMTFFDQLKQSNMETLYVIIVNIISYFVSSPIIFYIILHIIFLIFIAKGIYKLQGISLLAYSFIIYLNVFYYYGYVLNGIRQGLAIAGIILVFSLLVKGKKYKGLIISIVISLLHYSVIPFILLTYLVVFLNNKLKFKYLLLGYFIFSILYVFDLQTLFVGFIDSTYIETYTSPEVMERFEETNNINFLLFNTVFLSIFYIFYKNHFKQDKIYILLFKLYIVFSMIFILFGYIAFSNRLAAYSWFLIPILLSYYMVNNRLNILNGGILLATLIVGIITGVYNYFLI